MKRNLNYTASLPSIDSPPVSRDAPYPANMMAVGPGKLDKDYVYRTVVASITTFITQSGISVGFDNFSEYGKNILESGILAGAKVVTDLVMARVNITTAFNVYINSVIYTIATALIGSRSPAHLLVSVLTSIGSQTAGNAASDFIVPKLEPMV